MTDKRRKLIVLALISGVILIGTHKLMIASQIRSIFQNQGLENIELYVDHAGLTQSHLRDVLIGDTLPLEIGSALFEYSLPGLMKQHVQKVMLDNVKIESNFNEDAFVLHGLDGIVRDFMPPNSEMVIPSYYFDSNALPFDELHITNGRLHFRHKAVDITLFFNLNVVHKGDVKAHLNINQIKGTIYDFKITGDKLTAEMALEGSERWRGKWNGQIFLQNTNEKALPSLQLSGNLLAEPSGLNSKFKVSSTPEQVKLNAEMKLGSAGSYITLSQLQIPFAEGSLAVERLGIPFDIQNTIHFNVDCKNISTSKLLSLIFKGDVKAAGTLNGSLPLALTRAGTLIFYQSSLNSEDSSTVSIPAGLIPEQPRNTEAIRNELKSMDYERLAVEMESGEKDLIDFNIVFIGHPGAAKKGKPEAVNLQTKNNLSTILSQVSVVFTPTVTTPKATKEAQPDQAPQESPAH